MVMTRNRPLVRPHVDAYRALLAECRADLAQLDFENARRQADRDREIAALRAELEALKSIVRRRHLAEQELEYLRTLRDAEPELGQRLN
jgi:hypothetical protein